MTESGVVPPNENVWKLVALVCGGQMSSRDCCAMRLVNRECYRYFSMTMFYSPVKFNTLLEGIVQWQRRDRQRGALDYWLEVESNIDSIVRSCAANEKFRDAFNEWLVVACANNIISDVSSSDVSSSSLHGAIQKQDREQASRAEALRPHLAFGLRKIKSGIKGVVATSAAIVTLPLAVVVLPLLLLKDRTSDRILGVGIHPFVACAKSAIKSFDAASTPNLRTLPHYREQRAICECIHRIAEKINNSTFT